MTRKMLAREIEFYGAFVLITVVLHAIERVASMNAP